LEEQFADTPNNVLRDIFNKAFVHILILDHRRRL
jgi:hypothetical protein